LNFSGFLTSFAAHEFFMHYVMMSCWKKCWLLWCNGPTSYDECSILLWHGRNYTFFVYRNTSSSLANKNASFETPKR
jgi:Ni,Fe-hydrogenase I small subunit